MTNNVRNTTLISLPAFGGVEGGHENRRKLQIIMTAINTSNYTTLILPPAFGGVGGGHYNN